MATTAASLMPRLTVLPPQHLSTGPEGAWASAVGKGACLGQRAPGTQQLFCAAPSAPVKNGDH